MTYPVIVVCIAFAITTFLIVRVVPIFGEIFKDFGAKLPAPTQFLIDVSDFVRGEWYFLVVGIGSLIFGIRTFLRFTQIGRAACRERGEISVVAVSFKKKKTN